MIVCTRILSSQMFIHFTLSITYKKRVCFNGGGVMNAYKHPVNVTLFRKRTARTTLCSNRVLLIWNDSVCKCSTRCHHSVPDNLRVNTRNKLIEPKLNWCLNPCLICVDKPTITTSLISNFLSKALILTWIR